jgi:hypothetical protein
MSVQKWTTGLCGTGRFPFCGVFIYNQHGTSRFRCLFTMLKVSWGNKTQLKTSSGSHFATLEMLDHADIEARANGGRLVLMDPHTLNVPAFANN